MDFPRDEHFNSSGYGESFASNASLTCPSCRITIDPSRPRSMCPFCGHFYDPNVDTDINLRVTRTRRPSNEDALRLPRIVVSSF